MLPNTSDDLLVVNCPILTLDQLGPKGLQFLLGCMDPMPIHCVPLSQFVPIVQFTLQIETLDQTKRAVICNKRVYSLVF